MSDAATDAVPMGIVNRTVQARRSAESALKTVGHKRQATVNVGLRTIRDQTSVMQTDGMVIGASHVQLISAQRPRAQAAVVQRKMKHDSREIDSQSAKGQEHLRSRR